MAFAPLDVWGRMLARGGAWKRVRPRYWVRVAGGLFTSALGTALTLPERVVMGVLAVATRRSCGRWRPEVKVLCVLGYFRSGTTHLHYMLACDPANVTPKWYQALAPQGWVVSWAFLRWFLVPFLASTRPQDDVAIGPEWPAEDDFALCNWSLSSSMPGRMVLPREWARWKGLHNLEGVTERDLRRWREHVRAFAWKMGRGRVLLKNPSHTGRVGELVRVFGAENVRFIHVSREPNAVVRSNVAMHGRFEPYLLQTAVGDEEVRRRIIEEYDATERKFLTEAAELGPGMLARVRYQDLVADPIGQLRRAYAELGLSWSEALETRLRRYLASVRAYRAGQARGVGGGNPGPESAELDWMLDAFGHRAPTVAGVDLPHEPARDEGAWVGQLVVAALLWAAAWIGVARLTNDRLDWLVWPVGVALGTLALRAAGRGSARLGLAAGAATLMTMLVSSYPATAVVFYREREPMPFADVWDSTRDGMLAVNNMVWVFLGVASAYRLASRKQTATPGA